MTTKEILRKARALIEYAEEMHRCDLDWHSCDVPGEDCPHCAFMKALKEAAEPSVLTEAEIRINRVLSRAQLMAVRKEQDVTCKCGKVTGPVWKLYRCYYCGIFFCDRCAAEHFGQTREEHSREHYPEHMIPRTTPEQWLPSGSDMEEHRG